MKNFEKMYTLEKSLKIHIIKQHQYETNFCSISYKFVKYTTAFSIIYYKRNTKKQGDKVLLTISKPVNFLKDNFQHKKLYLRYNS